MRVCRNHFVISFLFIFLSCSTFALKPIRVLSIDGGGVKGLIVAMILEEIEKELNQPIVQIFDMLAGSSTGGMIVLALASPNQQLGPNTTTKAIADIYTNHCSNIFNSSWKHWLSTLGGLLGPKYDSTGLSELLSKHLGDTMLSEAVIPTLVTGYYIGGETGIEFFSEDAKAFPKDKDCLMREVGLATSAAPTFFESADVNFTWGKLNSIADGGLYKHNPTLLAYVNAKKLYPNRKIEVYSLGTGLISAEETTEQLKGRGLLQWLSPFLRHLQIGTTEADQTILHKLLNENGEENYFRLNVHIDKSHNYMDDISEENINYLHQKGLEAIDNPIFKKMIERLKSTAQI